jgi:bloom syndrome protein
MPDDIVTKPHSSASSLSKPFKTPFKTPLQVRQPLQPPRPSPPPPSALIDEVIVSSDDVVIVEGCNTSPLSEEGFPASTQTRM